MSMKNWLKKKIDAKTGEVGFETERLLLDLTEQLVDKLTTREMRRSQLAEAMGVDRAVVTRVLSGDHNATIRTLVGMAAALGSRLKVVVEDLRPASTSHVTPAMQDRVPMDMTKDLHAWLNNYPAAADLSKSLSAERGLSRQDSWTSDPAQV